MKLLFEFPENGNTRPAESTLSSLSKINNVDKIIFKILNNSNKLDLNEAIEGPHLSYWNFNEEIQIISYLYYYGALTYAPYSDDEVYKYSVKIPNKCAEKEYFDKLKGQIEQNTKNKIETALKILFNDNDITPLLEEIEQFFRDNTMSPDVAQSREDGMDWSIYILLKTHLEKQIERHTTLKKPNDYKTFYDDLIIFPDSHPQKIFLFEEKNIPFTNMTMSLIKYFQGKKNYPELNQKSWEKLFEVHKQIFFTDKLSNDEFAQIDIQYYDQESQKKKTISFANLVEEAKQQIKEYAKLITETPHFKGKEIIKFVVIRCGPSKLFGYKIE